MYLVHEMRVHRGPCCKWQGKGLLQGVAVRLGGISPGTKSGASGVCRLRPTVCTVVRNVQWYLYLMVFTLVFN